MQGSYFLAPSSGLIFAPQLRMVDEGTYGLVFLARDRATNELAALKKVKMSKDASSRDGFPITALRETNVLLALQHPNIVGVREMVVGKRMDEVFMVGTKIKTTQKA
jgi:cell division cycle 2-like protein